MSSEVDTNHEGIVSKAMSQLKEMLPEEFKKVETESEKLEEVKAAARKVAKEHLELSKLIRAGSSHSEIEATLLKHLPKHRVDMIKGGLNIPTYQVQLEKKSDGHTWVQIVREGMQLKPPFVFDEESKDDTKFHLITSMIIEATLLLCATVGIGVEIANITHDTIEDIKHHTHRVQSSSGVHDAAEKMCNTFSASSSSDWDKAKSISSLIKESHSAGITKHVIRNFCKEGDRKKIFTSAVVRIIMESDALFAMIALAILDGYEFVQKIKTYQALQ